MTSNTFSINCDELKKKVRSIRAGHLPAEDVIDAILKASADYDATEAEQVLYWIKQYLTNDEDRVGRYSEALQMEVQIMANRNGAWLMDDLRRLAQEFAVFDLYPNARQYWFGLSEDIVEDHNQWMECIFKKPNKTRIYNRIKKLLGDLLRSDFLNKEYADFIGIPPEEIDEARQELKDFGFDEHLDNIDGADWKYALLTKYIGEPVKGGETALPSRVRWYICKAHISNEAALAYFRYVALVQRAFEELDTPIDAPSEVKKAIDDFTDKLIQIAQVCYEEWNNMEVSQGGHLPRVKAVIKPNELKDFLEKEKKENYKELKQLCYPIKKNNNHAQMEYIAKIRERFFGKLPKSYIAQKAEPIFGLKQTYIAQRI